MPTKIFILVYIGSPLDYAKYRHTALFFELPEGGTSMMHVAGAHGFFAFEEQTNYNPASSRRLAKKLPVAELADSISFALIKATVTSTPINNQDREWNCQNWVGDALARLVNRGYLTSSQRTAGFDKMIDACLEAVDEGKGE